MRLTMINKSRHTAENSWTVPCRTCGETIELDTCPYVSFGSGASMKPGAIRCSHGHHHIYFPRDFGFVPCVAADSYYSDRAA